MSSPSSSVSPNNNVLPNQEAPALSSSKLSGYEYSAADLKSSPNNEVRAGQVGLVLIGLIGLAATAVILVGTTSVGFNYLPLLGSQLASASPFVLTAIAVSGIALVGCGIAVGLALRHKNALAIKDTVKEKQAEALNAVQQKNKELEKKVAELQKEFAPSVAQESKLKTEAIEHLQKINKLEEEYNVSQKNIASLLTKIQTAENIQDVRDFSLSYNSGVNLNLEAIAILSENPYDDQP